MGLGSGLGGSGPKPSRLGPEVGTWRTERPAQRPEPGNLLAVGFASGRLTGGRPHQRTTYWRSTVPEDDLPAVDLASG